MVEARLLSLVLRYPRPTALARRVRDRRVIPALRRLQARGLVARRRGLYRLTTRGEAELGVTRAVAQLLARTRAPG